MSCYQKHRTKSKDQDETKIKVETEADGGKKKEKSKKNKKKISGKGCFFTACFKLGPGEQNLFRVDKKM